MVSGRKSYCYGLHLGRDLTWQKSYRTTEIRKLKQKSPSVHLYAKRNQQHDQQVESSSTRASVGTKPAELKSELGCRTYHSCRQVNMHFLSAIIHCQGNVLDYVGNNTVSSSSEILSSEVAQYHQIMLAEISNPTKKKKKKKSIGNMGTELKESGSNLTLCKTQNFYTI